MVSIAAACKNVGDIGPRAACGAFHSPGSAKIEGFIVPDLPQNKQAADIYVATSVLQDILKFLVSPTHTLVQGISSDAFWKWKEEDDFEMSKKHEMANGKLLMALDDTIEKFRNERKIPVWFWLVDRGTLEDARTLAN